MTEVPPPPPSTARSLKDAAVEMSMDLVRAASSQPIMVGFLAVTLFIAYIAWQLSIEGRKMQHMEARFLLERCLPASRVQ